MYVDGIKNRKRGKEGKKNYRDMRAILPEVKFPQCLTCSHVHVGYSNYSLLSVLFRSNLGNVTA